MPQPPDVGTTTPRILHCTTVGLSLLCCAAWGLGALLSYPIIVIADSDLGAGAMMRVRDCSAMFFLSLAAAVVAALTVRLPRLGTALGILLLVAVARQAFESSGTSHEARWPLMAVVALVMAAGYAESMRRRHLPMDVFRPACLAVLLPALVVLTDWQGRVYLGQMPSSTTHRPARTRGLRTSISLADYPASARATSPEARLQAVGDEHGNLTVEPLDGGPPLLLPASARDRMLEVLTFSPDGKVLAVADDDRMYKGSTITVWDVAAGRSGKPPSAVLRHTLRGHPGYTCSLAFFPDGQMLASANGDQTVSVWDVATGEERARFIAHRHPRGYWEIGADCVATAPDGQTFATWGGDAIKLWSRESMGLLRVLDARGLGCSLAFTEDGRSLIAANREVVYYWSLAPSPLPFVGLLGATAAVIAWLFWSGSFSTPGLAEKAEVV